MDRFAKFLSELLFIIVGYLVYRLFELVGRMTLRLGRAVFSK